jgi:dienelactone hydrolase
MLVFSLLALFSLSPARCSGLPPRPPFGAARQTFTGPFDSSDARVDVYYPTTGLAEGRVVPLVSFAHGLLGGGDVMNAAYIPMLLQWAKYGFVVVAPRACSTGCKDTCVTLPGGDPACFGTFYEQQLLAIDWVREGLSADAKALLEPLVNHSVGYGIAGHSMGGQATLFSSSAANATKYNVKAAVAMHPYTHAFPAPTVPFLVFTGDKDKIAPENISKKLYTTPGGCSQRGFVNKHGANHLEPLFWNNQNALAAYGAAWMKVHLEQVPGGVQDGINYTDLVYGRGNASLCGGGDGAMVECDL